jgi:transposase-like protein
VVPGRGCVRGLPVVASLAGRDPLSALRGPGRLAAWQRPVGMRGLRASGVGDGGDDLSSHPNAAAAVVRCRVADDQPEARGLGVAIAVEIENPKGFGRIRLGHVSDVSQDSLLAFIDGAVEPGSTVHTDGWQAYLTLPDRGYEHERTVMRHHSDPAHVVMPGVHRVASLLDRWLLGTHQGAVSAEHLDAYLNEYAFRFNRRHSRRRGLLFYRLLEQAVVAEPVTYRGLVVNSNPTGRRPSIASGPGRVATVQAVDRPWRQTPAATWPPDSNR